MQRKSTGKQSISEQVKRKAAVPKKEKPAHGGNLDMMVSTGSTLLDLAISGGRIRGGGIPAGILVEIFGPSQSGKTVLLSEIAGNIQEMNGEVMFHDPEGRLNKQFARLFKFELDSAEYGKPNTVPEVFSMVRKWKPKNEKVVNAIFTDSLAALSTDLEMGSDEGDKMGMRRAKEFSEQLRKTCRILVNNNYLMVCSNQIRENIDGGAFSQKYKAPGGEGIGFYASLRLRTSFAKESKVKKVIKLHGKTKTKIVGVNVVVEVFKSSIWEPYHAAPLTIVFDYGIDDVRDNLQYVKTNTGATMYMMGGNKLNTSLNKSIAMIEDDDLEDELRDEVIDLWEEIEDKFKTKRKPKK
jgi:RecA/RadA recombinase